MDQAKFSLLWRSTAVRNSLQFAAGEHIGQRGSGVLEKIAENGHLSLLKKLHVECLPDCSTHMIDKAALNGHLPTIEHLQSACRAGGTKMAVYGACLGGHLRLLKWLEQHNFQCDSDAVIFAARGGQLHVVEWLLSSVSQDGYHAHSKKQNISKLLPALDGAALHGHLHVMEWLHSNHRIEASPQSIDAAFKGNHLKVVEWLHRNRPSDGCSPASFNSAAAHGNLAGLEWLFAHRPEVLRRITEEVALDAWAQLPMDYAALNGHLGVLEWLGRQGQACTTAAFEGAAAAGHLGAVEFLFARFLPEFGDEPVELVACAAAFKGQLAVLEWLLGAP
eukprot:CAMPEP_0194664320 /NCGR_PEP_ID=MMETSP0295-20121207/1386_1 /TAXON_ID=39354 /ORGANISM="Heterosigma akashiwo, Strain CCMP2393" /LENGTH=333 /DNA_ID=CAMNT_0039546029 /DNA_START=106 /DNA_END=1103 /DNA_ORIENTATION=-